MIQIFGWTAVVIGGLISIIVLGQFILTLLYTNGLYFLWWLGGGVKDTLELAKSKTLWEALKLSDPYPMSSDIQESLYVWPVALKSHGGSKNLVELGNSLKFSSQQLSGNTDQALPQFQVTFSKIFFVNPKCITHGCHGHYSLPKAAFLTTRFGGDPLCGGGIKYFWPPRWKNTLEWLRLRNTLRKKKFKAFVWKYSNYASKDFSGNFYQESFSNNQPRGFFDVLIGDPDAVRAYAELYSREVKPIEISFVAKGGLA